MATIKEQFMKFQNNILDTAHGKADIEELLNCYLSSSVCICDSLGVNQVAMGTSDGRALVVKLMTKEEFVNSKEKNNG